jgi:hypothetical protein
MSSIEASVIEVKYLSEDRIEEMYRLMQSSYENVIFSEFCKDLAEKQYCLVIEKEKQLKGFSSIEAYDLVWQGEKFHVIFSGDTIVHKSLRNSRILWLTFGRWMLDYSRDKKCIWFLISKSYRTYQYLPQNFLHYFPAFGTMDKNLSSLAKVLVEKKFGGHYDTDQMVIKAMEHQQYLKCMEQPKLRKSPHQIFYETLNPGYWQGDELICCAPFSVENLQARVLRQLLR